MRFKILKLLILIGISASCSQKTIPDHSKKNSDSEKIVEIFEGDESNEILSEKSPLISESLSDEELLNKLLKVEKVIFSSSVFLKKVHKSIFYRNSMTEFIDLFSVWKQGLSKYKKFNKKFEISLFNFKSLYLSQCVERKVEFCEMTLSALSEEKNTIEILKYFYERESSLLKKIEYMHIAFEIDRGRSNSSLVREYRNELLNLIENYQTFTGSLPIKVLERYFGNLVMILKLENWNLVTEEKTDFFIRLSPWNFGGSSNIYIDKIRLELVHFLPIYMENNSSIESKVHKYLNEELVKLNKESELLKSYPSYLNIKVDGLNNLNINAKFVLLAIASKKLSQLQIQKYIANSSVEDFDSASMFRIVKSIVRRKVSLLSIEIGEKVGEKFKNSRLFSVVDIQNAINFGNVYSTRWQAYRNDDLKFYKSLLLNQVGSIDDVLKKDIGLFFDSIDRSILKSLVYPMMLGVIYHAVKLETNLSLELTHVEPINWNYKHHEVINTFFSGKMRNYWFDFVESEKQLLRLTPETKKTLNRFEIAEVVHYFFSTKMYKKFGIEPDDFFVTIAKGLVQKRHEVVSAFFNLQKNKYLNEESPAARLLQWCEGIRSKTQRPSESLRLYELNRKNVPNFGPIEVSSNGDRTINSEDSLYFYRDEFEVSFDVISKFHQVKLNLYTRDVYTYFHNEYVPITFYFGELVDTYVRLQKEFPKEFGDLGVSRARKRVAEYLEAKQRFAGLQMFLSERYSDCYNVTLKESRRRSLGVYTHEKMYLEEVVYPVLKEVESGKLTLSEGNNILSGFNKMAEGEEKILLSKGGTLVYNETLLSFTHRVAAYMTKGLPVYGGRFSDVNFPEPVVGDSLKIDDFNPSEGELKRMKDPSDREKRKIILFSSEMTASQFSKIALGEFIDKHMSMQSETNRFTNWQRTLEELAFLNQVSLENSTQLFLFGKQKVVNYWDKTCHGIDIKKKSHCLVEKEVSVIDIARKALSSFDYINLDESLSDYFKVIGADGEANYNLISVVYKFDPTKLNTDIDENKHLSYSGINGVFDFVYDMMGSKYLGTTYTRVAETFSSGITDATAGSNNCSSYGSKCYWTHSEDMGQEMFYAYKFRPGVIFKQDSQAMFSLYRFFRDRIERKYSGLEQIFIDGGSILNKALGDGNKSIRPTTEDITFELYPLSLFHKNFNRARNSYFIEKTDSFFINELELDNFLKPSK